MPKNKNIEIRKLKQKNADQYAEIQYLTNVLAMFEHTVSDMISGTNRCLADLQFENPEQFEREMLQYSTIKRTLGIVQNVIRTLHPPRGEA